MHAIDGLFEANGRFGNHVVSVRTLAATDTCATALPLFLHQLTMGSSRPLLSQAHIMPVASVLDVLMDGRKALPSIHWRLTGSTAGHEAARNGHRGRHCHRGT